MNILTIRTLASCTLFSFLLSPIIFSHMWWVMEYANHVGEKGIYNLFGFIFMYLVYYAGFTFIPVQFNTVWHLYKFNHPSKHLHAFLYIIIALLLFLFIPKGYFLVALLIVWTANSFISKLPINHQFYLMIIPFWSIYGLGIAFYFIV